MNPGNCAFSWEGGAIYVWERGEKKPASTKDLTVFLEKAAGANKKITLEKVTRARGGIPDPSLINLEETHRRLYAGEPDRHSYRNSCKNLSLHSIKVAGGVSQMQGFSDGKGVVMNASVPQPQQELGKKPT